MNDFIKAKISKMKPESDEFFDLFTFICDEYYKFDKPDDFQMAVMVCHLFLAKSTNNYEDKVILMSKIIEQLYSLDPMKGGTCMFTLSFSEFLYNVSISSDNNKLDKMESLLSEMALSSGE